jgi:hypothetical protein
MGETVFQHGSTGEKYVAQLFNITPNNLSNEPRLWCFVSRFFWRHQRRQREKWHLHLEWLSQDGEAAPEPSSLEEIMAIAENKDGVAALIEAPAAEIKSVRINITMPADVLDQIDKYAEREGFTRSGFLAQAAKKIMAA